jgi:hypothetical protein
MPLPSNTDLAALDYVYLGAPFVQVEAKSLDTETLDVSCLGAPFVAVGPAAVAPGGLNLYVKIAGAWKQATAMWIREGGVWKQVSSVSSRIAGAWKS